MSNLKSLVRAQLKDGGVLVQGERDYFAEITDTATGKVWMTLTPATKADLAALELPDGFVPLGSALASMDRAGFSHAPEDADAPAPVMDIAGRPFINVARPEAPELPAKDGGPMRVMVNKGHVIGFEAGREVRVMDTAEGSFVELVGTSDNDDHLVLPEGASLRTVTLDAPLVISLPVPTTTYFWFGGKAARSFQGPVTVPELTA